MKKLLWVVMLQSLTMAAPSARADDEQNQFTMDESLSLPLSFKSKPLKILSLKTSSLKVKSHFVLIYDEQTQRPLYNKNAVRSCRSPRSPS